MALISKYTKFLTVFLVLFLAGCSAAKISKPSIDFLSKNKGGYHISSYQVDFRKQPESKTLLPKILKALESIETVDRPQGKPAVMKINIKSFNELNPGQSLLIGGDSWIEYSVRVEDQASKSLLYQIDLKDRLGHALGGVFGMISAAATDDELELANKLAKRVKISVLHANNITVARK